MREKPSLLKKQQRRQRQSCVNTSENKVHLHEQKDSSRGQNSDHNSWMPDVQKTFLWNSHLQACLPRHHDECKREEVRATHRDVILPVLRRKFQNQLDGEFAYEDWLRCLYHRSFKTRFEICKAEDGELSDFRAIRRHSSEIIIPPRLMNYVMILYKG